MERGEGGEEKCTQRGVRKENLEGMKGDLFTGSLRPQG